MNTKPRSTTLKYARTLIVATIIIWCAYAALTLLTPNTESVRHYNLTNSSANLIRLSFMLPLLGIWLVALQGTLAFKRYAKLIANGTEGRGINLIANGLLWIIAYFIISALVSAALPHLVHTPVIQPAVALRNHLPVLIAGVGFWLIYIGSHQLRQVAPFVTWTPAAVLTFTGYAIFSGLFAYLFLTSPLAADPNRVPVYALPREYLLFTLVLPLLSAWFAAIFACINILKYARIVKGVIYRQALRQLVFGILAVSLFTVLVQLLSVLNRFVAALNLASVLMVIYALLLCLAVGCWLIQRGAKQLARIEVPG